MIDEGKAWLGEESNNSTFVQIVQQLDGAMTAAFSRYLDILSKYFFFFDKIFTVMLLIMLASNSDLQMVSQGNFIGKNYFKNV